MLQALSFMTIFGRSHTPAPRAVVFFPLVGALVGLAVGGVWWGAAQLWPPIVVGAIALAADAVLTGMLHLDGLTDCGDGLVAPMDRDRRLTVMRDPAVGAFGAITLAVVLLARFAGLVSLPSHWTTLLTIGALWCVSRTIMAIATRTMRYARSGGGIVSAFTGARRSPWRWLGPLLLGLVIAMPLAWFGNGLHGLLAVAGVVLGAGLVLLLAQRRLGGFTGDVLGGAGVLGETVGVLVLVAA